MQILKSLPGTRQELREIASSIQTIQKALYQFNTINGSTQKDADNLAKLLQLEYSYLNDVLTTDVKDLK